MDPAAEAAGILDRAGIPYAREGRALRVAPADPEGFEVWIGPGNAWQVAYEGWHDDFQDPEQALSCFLMGLTEALRLRIVRRGGSACAWTPEMRDGEGWKAVGTVGRIFVPFWRRKEVVVLQNRRPILPPR